MVALDWKHGDYLGTLAEGQGAVWAAHTKEARLDHGHGKYLIDALGVRFHKTHGEETFIPFAVMQGIEQVRRFAGKYTVGDFITKIIWAHEGKVYESGFVFAKNAAQNAEILERIKLAAPELR